jgi:hypothetical protein
VTGSIGKARGAFRYPWSVTDDYRGDYAQAVQQAIDGRVGFYPDFDQRRQEEIWRLLSTDRDRLLTFCRRHEITIGRLELRKTLKSPKPLYELVAVGDDAESVRQYLGLERVQR